MGHRYILRVPPRGVTSSFRVGGHVNHWRVVGAGGGEERENRVLYQHWLRQQQPQGRTP